MINSTRMDIAALLEQIASNPEAEPTAEEAGALSDYYWNQIAEDDHIIVGKRTPELDREIYRWTAAAARLDPYNYSYRMGQCYAEGIDCDAEKGKRIARKYWEDAYDFGCWWAADSIADLYEKDLAGIPDTPEYAARRNNSLREIESWRRMAQRARERAGQPGWASRK